MELPVILIFSFVYTGMFLGKIPGLALDRTGIALLGAIFVVFCGILDPHQAWDAVDVPTIALLFGLMVVSAQFRLGGFYTSITRKLAGLEVSPRRTLLLLMAVAGLLSAILVNDIICLAMTPILIEGCSKRKLNPIPFVLGLACAANIGSAATLIGNPQNMLIGQKLHLSFSGYLLDSMVPSILGIFTAWGVISWLYHRHWIGIFTASPAEATELNRWQSTKGFVIITILLTIFLFTSLPREVAALAAAGVCLMSHKIASRKLLGLVDWNILLLFIGLFVVNHALEHSGLLTSAMRHFAQTGIHIQHPGILFIISAILSNMVSNVPAVMLLLPAATHPMAGAILALSSTLAGNLTIVGSIANIIVADKAKQSGITIDWREHTRIGIPVTVLTLLITAGWLWLRIWYIK